MSEASGKWSAVVLMIVAALLGTALAWGCLLVGGGGHGTVVPALILFPAALITAWLTHGDVVWVYFLALCQFPAYVGVVLLADHRGWTRRRRAALGILLIQCLALALAIAMMPFYYG